MKNYRYIRLFILLVLFFQFTISSAFSEENKALFLGKVVNAKYIGNKKQKNDEIFFGAQYEITVKNIDIIWGDILEDTLTFYVTAANPEYMTESDRVLLFVEYDSARIIKSANWWPLSEISCIKKEFINKKSIGIAFEGGFSIDDEICLSF